MAKITKEMNTVKFLFRCPKALHAKLTRLATKEGRSMHTQLVFVLEEYFKRGP